MLTMDESVPALDGPQRANGRFPFDRPPVLASLLLALLAVYAPEHIAEIFSLGHGVS